MSYTFRQLSGAESTIFRMLSADFGERCARVPQHTTSAVFINSTTSGVHSIESHATFSMISYCGMPSAPMSTRTCPVGMALRCTYERSSPDGARALSASSPRASFPTADTGYAMAPNAFEKYAKLTGAPPIRFPSGSTSHTISPIPMIFFIFSNYYFAAKLIEL